MTINLFLKLEEYDWPCFWSCLLEFCLNIVMHAWKTINFRKKLMGTYSVDVYVYKFVNLRNNMLKTRSSCKITIKQITSISSKEQALFWHVSLNSLWSTQYACKLNAFNIPYMYIVNDLSLTRAVSCIGERSIWQLFYNEVSGKNIMRKFILFTFKRMQEVCPL